MSEDLRGVFFIVKGQYRKGVAPSFVNKATNETSWLGGYDPHSDATEEWYMCLDRITFQCCSCGGDLKKVLKAVYTCIVKYKDLKHYLHHISKMSSDDTYEVMYLGKRPLTPDERVKKAEGRCPRVSPAMGCLYEAIYEEYGDYYSDLIEEQEDLAYEKVKQLIKENKPINKTKKRLGKVKTKTIEVETPKKEEVKPKLVKVKPKVKLGIKKLSMV